MMIYLGVWQLASVDLAARQSKIFARDRLLSFSDPQADYKDLADLRAKEHGRI